MENFMIINVDEIDKIDFSQILDTYQEVVERAEFGRRSFVNWNGNVVPSSIEELIYKEGPYTQEEILMIVLNGQLN